MRCYVYTSEVPVYKMTDLGTGNHFWETGTKIVGHRYRVHIDGDWWEINGRTHGSYTIRPTGTGTTREDVTVVVDKTIVDDAKTYVEVLFRVSIQVTPIDVTDIGSIVLQ